MVEFIDAVVVGAGVVGLAIGRRLARAGNEVVVLESAETIGSATSSRNSEVIHAGIYYPAGSLKARLCVEGKEALYTFCSTHGVAHKQLGKLIVATEDRERTILEDLICKGVVNGVDDLSLIDGAAAQRLEPNLHCIGAVVSPSTGIVDSHGYMLALQGDAEDLGATIAFRSPLKRVNLVNGAIEAVVGVGGGETARLRCHLLINAAGLGAWAVARTIEGLHACHIPPRYLAKGSYFALRGRAPFTRLIYPTPQPGSLGVHFTADLAGQPRFGPDFEVVDSIDYDVDPTRAVAFYEEIRRYYPDLRDGSLHPAYSGMRPKIQAPGAPAHDFVIQGPAIHSIAGMVNLFGIESPGLTSALAIADYVYSLVAN